MILVAALISGLSHAQTRPVGIDCSLIYDEYDSLMAAGYLQAPATFIAGYDGWLSQPAFDSMQRGIFRLHPERGETGVIVFRTNENRHGKLLYYWTDPLVDGRRYLVISESAWYARVADGAGLQLFGKLRANSGLGVDLDNMVLVELEQEELSDEQGEISNPTSDDIPNPGPGASNNPAAVEPVTGDNIQMNTGAAAGTEIPQDQATEGESVPDDREPDELPEIVLDRTLPADAADLSVMRDETTGVYYLAAVNGASLYFPVESLCAIDDL